MRKFAILLVTLSTLFFGVQSITVSADAPKCEPLKTWSPTDTSLSGAQLDEACNEYYIEPAPKDLLSRRYLKQMLSTAAPNFNPSDAFTLHSNPTANAIIYLDFDGQTWESGMWWINSYGIEVGETSAGYTLDSDPTTFTELERIAIYEIWSNVAEDFAPFNVDVTTERPTGARDTVFRTRGSHALILSEASVQQGCGCGGVAYVDVFGNGNPWQYPALNFSKFGTYYAPPIDVAEIISHEVGHNLGLAHDGTTTGIEYYSGHAMWTPIMGAGRGLGIATWSYGGYPNADTRWNQRAGDDDFAQMSLFLDMFVDDHGDDLASATIASPGQVVSGKITTTIDKDFFKFTVPNSMAGLWQLQLIPAPYAPNLDPELTLYDGNGNVVEVSNPLVSAPSWMTYITSGLDALIERELTAGTYYLSVDGVGQGSLSAGTGFDDYASRGNYQIRFGSEFDGIFIDSVTPSAVNRGSAVEILGNNLDEITGLSLNGTSINDFSLVSENQVVFGVPTGATSGRLVATSALGDVTVTENLAVVASAVAPTITSLSSSSGILNQVITVNGTNLGAATSVKLAGQEIEFEVTGKNSLRFQVTQGMSTGKLMVATAGGSVEARGTFNVLIPLSIESFSPERAGVGSVVVIRGTNFTSGTTITFFDGAKVSRPTITPTEIRVTVPRGAQTGPITLSNNLGSSSTLTNFVLIAPAPTITGLSPTSARVGNTVTVNGANFVNVQSVRIGSMNVAFTVVSATRIQFIVPAGAVSGSVFVTTESGTAQSRTQLRIR